MNVSELLGAGKAASAAKSRQENPGSGQSEADSGEDGFLASVNSLTEGEEPETAKVPNVFKPIEVEKQAQAQKPQISADADVAAAMTSLSNTPRTGTVEPDRETPLPTQQKSRISAPEPQIAQQNVDPTVARIERPSASAAAQVLDSESKAGTGAREAQLSTVPKTVLPIAKQSAEAVPSTATEAALLVEPKAKASPQASAPLGLGRGDGNAAAGPGSTPQTYAPDASGTRAPPVDGRAIHQERSPKTPTRAFVQDGASRTNPVESSPVQAAKAPEPRAEVRIDQTDSANRNIDPEVSELQRKERREEHAAVDLKRAENKALQNPNVGTPLKTAVVRSFTSAAQSGDTNNAVTTLNSTNTAAVSATPADGRPDRITTAGTASPPAPDAATRSTLAQITAAIRNQPLGRTVELSLDPPELGRIEIQIEVAEIGLKATLSAERSITTDMIRRQADLLQQELNDAGFKDVDIDFRDFGSGGREREETGSKLNHTHSGDFSQPATTTGPSSSTRLRIGVSGMDLRL